MPKSLDKPSQNSRKSFIAGAALAVGGLFTLGWKSSGSKDLQSSDRAVSKAPQEEKFKLSVQAERRAVARTPRV